MPATERILIIVPARGGAKRLPRKNMLTLGGKSLVTLAIECGQQIEGGEVVLSTDCTRICADGWNAHARVLLRPSCLGLDNTPTEDVVRHVCWSENAAGREYDYVMVLQPTSPLRTPAVLRQCLHRIKLPGKADWVPDVPPDSVTTVSRVESIEKLWVSDAAGDNSAAAVIVRAGASLTPTYRRNGLCYLTRWHLAIRGDLYGTRRAIIETPDEISISIDTERDWKEVQRRYGEQGGEAVPAVQGDCAGAV